MERATVEVESVSSRMMENKIGYISISGFKEKPPTAIQGGTDGTAEGQHEGADSGFAG